MLVEGYGYEITLVSTLSPDFFRHSTLIVELTILVIASLFAKCSICRDSRFDEKP